MYPVYGLLQWVQAITFLSGWGGKICPSEGIWVLVSQARNINSHLLDIGRFSVATTYVQHFKLLFSSEDDKSFHRPLQMISRETGQSCMQMLSKYSFPLVLRNLSFPHQECDQGKKLYISFAFLHLADHTSSQFKSKWLTVLHNIESKPHFLSPVKQSFYKLFQQDSTTAL